MKFSCFDVFLILLLIGVNAVFYYGYLELHKRIDHIQTLSVMTREVEYDYYGFLKELHGRGELGEIEQRYYNHLKKFYGRVEK